MSLPILMLLGFAAWTIVLLLATIGVYRWIRILAGPGLARGFGSEEVQGEDWYRRSVRAHANGIENLPVFGAIVLALHAGAVGGALVDGLAVTILAARIAQSSVHVAFIQTKPVVAARLGFFFVQIASFVALIGIIVAETWQGAAA